VAESGANPGGRAAPPGRSSTTVWVVRLMIAAMAAAITWLLLHLL
jgi:hypothetical protein